MGGGEEVALIKMILISYRSDQRKPFTFDNVFKTDSLTLSNALF
jgi:hypothetical protein